MKNIPSLKRLAGFGISLFVVFSLFAQPVKVDASSLYMGRNSSNWSGYVMTTDYYTGVKGSWTIPTSSPGASVAANAEWVGIGGQRTSDLIQAGTLATYINGQLTYKAWVETLPNNAEMLAMEVKPGDNISVSLTETSPDVWALSFSNNTTGQLIERNINYASSHSSAEWIEEDPYINGSVAALSNFNSVSFTGAEASVGESKLSLNSGGAENMDMISPNGQIISRSGSVGESGEDFSVTRENVSGAIDSVAPAQIVPSSVEIILIDPGSSSATVTPVPFTPQSIQTPITPIVTPVAPITYQILPPVVPTQTYVPIVPPLPINQVSVIRFSPTTGLPVTPFVVTSNYRGEQAIKVSVPKKTIKKAVPAKKKVVAKKKTKTKVVVVKRK